MKQLKSFFRRLSPKSIWGIGRAYSKPLNLYETNRFNFFPVSLDPPVIYTFTGWSLGNVFTMSAALGTRQASFIVGFTRFPASWKLRYLRRQMVEYEGRYPRNKVVFIANSPEERDNMRQFGFEAHFINKNAFQREDQFTVEPESVSAYDAVMNARLARWKRMELASDVDRLALITVLGDEEYYAEMRETLPHADWVNFDAGDKYEYLSQAQINHVLNRSKVGLILSAFEGNNKASIEYLLSGLPVVSTPSKGGRDVFFDPDYCAIVDPSPAAVKNGVQELIDRDINPHHVREQTLKKIRAHRQRFLDLAHELSDGACEIDVDDWLDRFPRNMKFRCQPEHFRAILESDYFTDGRPAYTSEHGLRKHDPDLWSKITS